MGWDDDVQSSMEGIASVHTFTPVITFVLNVLRKGLLRPYFTLSIPVKTFMFKVLRKGLPSSLLYTHARTCDNVRVQGATEGTAFVHTSHMPKRVITFVFKDNRETRCTFSKLKNVFKSFLTQSCC